MVTKPNAAWHSRIAFSSTAPNTDSRAEDEALIMCRTWAVEVSCPRASISLRFKSAFIFFRSTRAACRLRFAAAGLGNADWRFAICAPRWSKLQRKETYRNGPHSYNDPIWHRMWSTGAHG